VLNALSELKKYKKINLNNTVAAGSGGNDLDIAVSRIAQDVNRIAKDQFKLGQQVEDYSEEILGILQNKLDIEEAYKKWVFSRDDLINELKTRADENNKRVESLVAGLICFYDAMDTISVFIASSGDTDWIVQMERLKNSLTVVMAENDLHVIGNEKYFDDMLHDAVDVVEDRYRDFREITGVERNGFSYLKRIIRKAAVIVNNFKKDENEDKNEDESEIEDDVKSEIEDDVKSEVEDGVEDEQNDKDGSVIMFNFRKDADNNGQDNRD
jgi:molecular chaperone GrpE (heat shock protein)